MRPPTTPKPCQNGSTASQTTRFSSWASTLHGTNNVCQEPAASHVHPHGIWNSPRQLAHSYPTTPEIETLRQNMWTMVAQRRHTVFKIFPAGVDTASGSSDTVGCDGLEFMLLGKVDHLLRSGEERCVHWAGHGAVCRRTEADRWRFTYYRVYMQQE